jgi:hypothetical protein
MDAVAAHVRGENLEESNVADRIDKSAYNRQGKSYGEFAPRAEIGSVSHRCFSASLAAL